MTMPTRYERSGLTPAGVEYTIRSRSGSVTRPTTQPPRCTLLHVAVANNDDFLRIPCFTCSGFSLSGDYYAFYEACLTDTISGAHIPHDCAARVAGDVAHNILTPANANARHCLDDLTTVEFVSVYVSPRRVPRADSFEEAGPRREPATVREQLDRLRARVSDMHRRDRDAMGVADDAFHEKCLLRWLDNNHACPLCRFKLPCETNY